MKTRPLLAAALATLPRTAAAAEQLNVGVTLLFGGGPDTPVAVEVEAGAQLNAFALELRPGALAFGPVVEARFGKEIRVSAVGRVGFGAYGHNGVGQYAVTEVEGEGGVSFGKGGIHPAWGAEAQLLFVKFAVRGSPGADESLWMGPGLELGVLGFTPDQYFYTFAIDGRPYRQHGRMVRPRVVGDRRDPRAARWLDAASEELGAVAAFERLAAELRLLGAPGELIARAELAAAEERGHARMCLRRAAAWSEHSPVATPIRSQARRVVTRDHAIAILGVESLLDGFDNEGRAADQHLRDVDAGERADRPTHHRIATEERTHATFGDDLYAWARREAPTATRRALARLG